MILITICFQNPVCDRNGGKFFSVKRSEVNARIYEAFEIGFVLKQPQFKASAPPSHANTRRAYA